MQNGVKNILLLLAAGYQQLNGTSCHLQGLPIMNPNLLIWTNAFKTSASMEKALLDIWYIVEQDKGEEGGGVGSWPQEPSSGDAYNILHIFFFQSAAFTNQFTDKTIQWKKKKKEISLYCTSFYFNWIFFTYKHIQDWKYHFSVIHSRERERKKKYKLKSKEHFSWPLLSPTHPSHKNIYCYHHFDPTFPS